MKNTFKPFGTQSRLLCAIALLAIIGFSMAACNSDASDNAQQLNATAASFDEVFNSIKAKPGNYVINLTGDLIDYTGAKIETAGVNITVKGTGANKITWKYVDDSPTLFQVDAGKLTLENINLSRSPGNTKDWPLIVMYGGTIEVKNGVVLSNNNGSQSFIGVWLQAGTFIMSGGIIENCDTGVSTAGKGVSIAFSGGTIRNNHEGGIIAWDDSENCVVSISGGTISGNNLRGVMVVGTGGKLTMSGGTITGGAGRGVVIGGSGTKFTMSGGTISKNATWGLNLAGADIEFEKKKGAVIYGNSGDNKNNEGAIWVNTRGNPSNDLKLLLDAGKDDAYAIKTNTDNTDIVAGSKQGPNW
jgi:hypothetical protein